MDTSDRPSNGTLNAVHALWIYWTIQSYTISIETDIRHVYGMFVGIIHSVTCIIPVECFLEVIFWQTWPYLHITIDSWQLDTTYYWRIRIGNSESMDVSINWVGNDIVWTVAQYMPVWVQGQRSGTHFVLIDGVDDYIYNANRGWEVYWQWNKINVSRRTQLNCGCDIF
jgi:hypothetical protein